MSFSSLNNMAKFLFQKGHRFSQEVKAKISAALKGKPKSEAHKRKLSESHKGIMPENVKDGSLANFNRGKKRPPFSEEWKRNISLGHKGQHPVMEFKKGQKAWNKGMKFPELSGPNSPSWKGGLTPIHNKIRCSVEYMIWQEAVFVRDEYRCQKCGERRKAKVTAHHILNFAQHPQLRFAIDNGITVCRPCHKEFHHIYGKKNNTLQQIQQFTGI